MPVSGGWREFGGPMDPRDAHIRVWLDTLMAAKAQGEPAPVMQPQYRTGCPACYVAMTSSQWNVDAGLTEGRLSLSGRVQHVRRTQRLHERLELMEKTMTMAGRSVRAWVYFCAKCSRNETVYTRTHHIDKAGGDRHIREIGWSLSHGVWTCPSCKRG